MSGKEIKPKKPGIDAPLVALAGNLIHVIPTLDASSPESNKLRGMQTTMNKILPLITPLANAKENNSKWSMGIAGAKLYTNKTQLLQDFQLIGNMMTADISSMGNSPSEQAYKQFIQENRENFLNFAQTLKKYEDLLKLSTEELSKLNQYISILQTPIVTPAAAPIISTPQVQTTPIKNSVIPSTNVRPASAVINQIDQLMDTNKIIQQELIGVRQNIAELTTKQSRLEQERGPKADQFDMLNAAILRQTAAYNAVANSPVLNNLKQKTKLLSLINNITGQESASLDAAMQTEQFKHFSPQFKADITAYQEPDRSFFKKLLTSESDSYKSFQTCLQAENARIQTASEPRDRLNTELATIEEAKNNNNLSIIDLKRKEERLSTALTQNNRAITQTITQEHVGTPEVARAASPISNFMMDPEDFTADNIKKMLPGDSDIQQGIKSQVDFMLSLNTEFPENHISAFASLTELASMQNNNALTQQVSTFINQVYQTHLDALDPENHSHIPQKAQFASRIDPATLRSGIDPEVSNLIHNIQAEQSNLNNSEQKEMHIKILAYTNQLGNINMQDEIPSAHDIVQAQKAQQNYQALIQSATAANVPNNVTDAMQTVLSKAQKQMEKEPGWKNAVVSTQRDNAAPPQEDDNTEMGEHM